jgi:hypothetical protein
VLLHGRRLRRRKASPSSSAVVGVGRPGGPDRSVGRWGNVSRPSPRVDRCSAAAGYRSRSTLLVPSVKSPSEPNPCVCRSPRSVRWHAAMIPTRPSTLRFAALRHPTGPTIVPVPRLVVRSPHSPGLCLRTRPRGTWAARTRRSWRSSHSQKNGRSRNPPDALTGRDDSAAGNAGAFVDSTWRRPVNFARRSGGGQPAVIRSTRSRRGRDGTDLPELVAHDERDREATHENGGRTDPEIARKAADDQHQ